MPTLKRSHILIPALMLLSACGGGSGGCAPSDARSLDTTTDTSANCADTRAANSVIISFPYSNAIEQLPGGLSALYSFKGTLTVTDQNSNPVPDGTVIQLDMLDTLIARGTILAADSDTIVGSTITDATPLQGDEATATTFLAAAVDRVGDSGRKIQVGDLVILTNAPSSDRVRYVSSKISDTVITVDSPYNNTYPSANYPNAQYRIGESLIGTAVVGIDSSGNKTGGVAMTEGGNGTAAFRMEYPGNSQTLFYGSPSIPDTSITNDPRYAPAGSTEIWVIANAGGGVASATRTSLKAIAPLVLTVDRPAVDIAQNQTTNVLLTLKDGGAVPIAGFTITASSSNSNDATSGGCTPTNSNGKCTATISVPGAATLASKPIITFSDGDEATVGVTVTVQ